MTLLKDTAMEAAREIHVELTQKDYISPHTSALIIARYFQPLLAKVEGERDALDRAVTLNRNNWRIDSEEKDAVISALRADLAEAKEALDSAVTRAQNSGNGLYQNIVATMEPHFPKDTRDLEWDVLPSTIGKVMADLAAKEAALTFVPSPEFIDHVILRTQAIGAAENMDWGQVICNGGPPCFAVMEDGRFCGRAERWFGHSPECNGNAGHKFVSLADLLSALASRADRGGDTRETAGFDRCHSLTHHSAHA